MYIISGCNGSGKTTASYALLPQLLECRQFVNSDEFAKSLSPFSPQSASIAASRLMIRKIRYLVQRKEDFCIETTLATRSLKSIIEDAHSHGYRVTVFYMWIASPDLAVERVKARVAAGISLDSITYSGNICPSATDGFWRTTPQSLSGSWRSAPTTAD